MANQVSIFAVFDRVTGTYNMYYAAANDEDARRNAVMALRNHAYVEDFEIWHICDIDADNHEIEKRFYLVDRLPDLLNGVSISEVKENA